jgi:restriction endonuclease S subunit
MRLQDCCLSISDGDHMPPPKAKDGIPFITISNIDKNTNKIIFKDTFYVSRYYFDSLKKDRIPKIGDVLYTVTGSFGIPVLIDFQKEFCFQRHIALIRPDIGLLSSTYLFYWILSSYATSQAEDTATGAAQRTVSLNSLRNFAIQVPSLPEQQSIVATLDSLKSKVDRLQANYAKITQECDALKQAILRQVFE